MNLVPYRQTDNSVIKMFIPTHSTFGIVFELENRRILFELNIQFKVDTEIWLSKQHIITLQL